MDARYVHLGCLRHWIRGRLNLSDRPLGSYFYRPLMATGHVLVQRRHKKPKGSKKGIQPVRSAAHFFTRQVQIVIQIFAMWEGELKIMEERLRLQMSSATRPYDTRTSLKCMAILSAFGLCAAACYPLLWVAQQKM